MINKICKHCGKPIPKGGVWNPDNEGNGYHHKCLIDMEFDENETYIENLKKRAIVIPKGATNGDVMMTVFKEVQYYSDGKICADWWNEPYKGAKK